MEAVTAPASPWDSALGSIELVTDAFEAWPLPADSGPGDAEGTGSWPGHLEALAADAARLGIDESVVTGEGRIGGRPAVVVAFEFGFRGGTLGRRAGDAVVAAIDHAAATRTTLVSLIASGGARVQEGMGALVQMQRIAAALARSRRAGVGHLAVLRDPSAGGVWASLGAAADVTVALRGAAISFAGARVRAADEPASSFGADAQGEAGAVDAVVDPHEAVHLVRRWAEMLADAAASAAEPCPPPLALGSAPRSARAWSSVLAARDPERPRAGEYLDRIFAERLEISGDRAGGVDPGVACGLGLIRDREGTEVAAYAAQTGAATRPAGFRTVVRILRLAERLGVPVLTLIDTPGAAADATAEADCVGPSIAEALIAVADLRVPVTSVLIGEGGSGGALALASPGRLWVAPDSYFSVTAPEMVAEIVHRDQSRAAEVSEHLGLRPTELVGQRIARAVLEAA